MNQSIQTDLKYISYSYIFVTSISLSTNSRFGIHEKAIESINNAYNICSPETQHEQYYNANILISLLSKLLIFRIKNIIFNSSYNFFLFHYMKLT